jgi:alkanesulfonate monooxygenase SsuD/methylene tetrahydromethanopterin reductase-like flavin-dependent oxidoreductase (luciferase family)
MPLQFGWWDHFEQRAEMPLWRQYDERIGLIRQAEAYGFYGYHVAEHHFTPLDMAPSPMVFLAAVARQTSSIRLGTMVLCLPLYHPTRLIQEFCMLDNLCHGRFMPGVGRGVRDVEHEWFGGSIGDTRAKYAEVLAILRQGLSQGRITFNGRYFHYDAVPTHFSMYQNRYPRFWYAGNLQHAAEGGMNAFGRAGPGEIAQYWQIWRDGRARNDPLYDGTEPLVGSIRHLVVADTDREAVSLARRAFRAYADHFHATALRLDGGLPQFGGLPRPFGANFDELLEAGVVMAGSVAKVRDGLLTYLARVGPGHTYLAAAFQWGDMTTEEAERSLNLFAREVKPAVGGETASS